MSTVLNVQALTKNFGARKLFKDITFSLNERERVALIGTNGCGKSTLLRMLVCAIGGSEHATHMTGGAVATEQERDAMEPDDGQITWRKGLLVRYVAQEPMFAKGATVESVLQTSGAEDYEIATVHSKMNMPPMEQTIESTSIGERRRVALGTALLCKPDVLCLDEPTNHLDMATIEWLEQHLQTFSGALIVVTHDRYFLDRVAGRIIEIEHGHAYAYEGDYTEFLLRQAERHAVAAIHEHERAMFVRREIDWIRRMPKARTTKSKSRIERFDDAVAAKPLSEEATRQMALRLPSGPRLGSTIIELDAVSKNMEGKKLFSNLTLKMKAGDRIGIVGPNGVGKTTLIRTILGQLKPDTGKVVLGINTQIAYMDQSRAALDDNKTVLQEVSDGSEYVELPDSRIHVRSFLKMMLFPDTSGQTKIGQLSGGERNRVQLAKLLRRGGNVLVLDEPTNDLDIMTLGALEDALVHYNGCALIVSHDRWFLDRVVTGILAFESEGQVTFYEGDYSSYANKREANGKQKTSVPPPISPHGSSSPSQKPQPKKLNFKEKTELDGMEKNIAVAEAKVAELEAVLADPQTYQTRGAEVASLTSQLEIEKNRVESLFARWDELDRIAKSG